MFRPKTPVVPAAAGSTTANALATTTTSVNVSNAAVPDTLEQQLEITSLSPLEASWQKSSPRRFNVKRHGVLGDGKEHYGTSINATSTTLTCTDGSFAASDVGKIIGVENAGAGGSWLITTIATYISATQVTVALAASYTVNSIATVAGEITTFYGTDDTVALQTLINSAFRTDSTHWNGNCEFFFPNALYIIGGALQTAVTGFSSTAINYNSQLYIPNLPYKPSSGNLPEFSYRCTMLFKGETRPHFTALNSIGTAQSPRWGARIRSTLQTSSTYSGQLPSILCAKGGAHTTDNWSQISDCMLHVEDMIFEMTTNSSNQVHMSAVNGAKAKSVRYNRVHAYPHNRIGAATVAGYIAEPVLNTAGLISAQAGDEPGSHFSDCMIAGFYYGYVSGEHLSIDRCMAWACVAALGVSPTAHATFINAFEATGCKYYVTRTNAFVDSVYAAITSGLYGTITGEGPGTTDTSAWTYTQAIINDPDDKLWGKVEFLSPHFPDADIATFASKIGGENLKLSVSQNYSPIATHTGTTYTLQYFYEAEQDHNFSSANPITLTFPRGDTATRDGYRYNYNLGAEIKGMQGGAGQITFAAASGVTLRLPTGMTKTAGQYSEFTARKIATNTWRISGDLA